MSPWILDVSWILGYKGSLGGTNACWHACCMLHVVGGGGPLRYKKKKILNHCQPPPPSSSIIKPFASPLSAHSDVPGRLVYEEHSKDCILYE